MLQLHDIFFKDDLYFIDLMEIMMKTIPFIMNQMIKKISIQIIIFMAKQYLQLQARQTSIS